jgi:uncharacterized membrane protein HdeD (DUF308 family)
MAVQETANVQAVEDTGRTVGTKEQLGAGVIALGIFALLMPWASTEIAGLVDGADPYAILSGSVMVLGLFILAAGIAIIVQRLDD